MSDARTMLATLPADEAERAIRDELLRRDAARRGVEPLSRYRNDLAGFAERELGQTLWDRQRELHDCVTAHVITLVASGQKTGKTRSFATIPAGWVMTRERGLVIMTSGNKDQLRTQNWRELQDLDREVGLVKRFGGVLHKDPARGWELGDGRAIYGLTADEAQAFAGHSGLDLLTMIDEASLFADEKWEVVRGNALSGGHIFACGQLTRTTGWFYRGHTRERAAHHCLRIDSRENPNYRERRIVIAGLATYESITKLERDTGGDGTPIFDVRVAGKAPSGSTDAVISLGAVEAALERHPMSKAPTLRPVERVEPTGRIVLGVDVARFGDDDSVVQGCAGAHAFPSRVVHGMDTVAVAELAVDEAARLRTTLDRERSELVTVYVDSSGVGAGVADTLRRWVRDGRPLPSGTLEEVGLEVVDVDAGAVPLGSFASEDTPVECVRRRDELWWGLRLWLRTGALPPDSVRDEELLAPTYSFDGKLRIVVQSKDEIRSALEPKRSPDRADALALAVLPPRTPAMSGVYRPPKGHETAPRPWDAGRQGQPRPRGNRAF